MLVLSDPYHACLLICYFLINCYLLRCIFQKIEQTLKLLGELHLLQEPNFAAAASYFVGLLPFGPTSTKLRCC